MKSQVSQNRFWGKSQCVALVLLGCIALAGCYTTRNRLPSNAKSIAIPVFGNKTYHEDYTRALETELSESVRSAFLENGMLKVTGREDADLIVEGDVLRIARSILRTDRLGDPNNVQYTITARISLYDVKQAKYILRDGVYTNTEKTESGVYNLNRGENEDLGRKNAVQDLGRIISRHVLDLW